MLPIQISLPEGFLDEEVRCDYLISKEMKKIWAVELDLLVVLQQICEKHNIKYFAYGGTLLGCVRHKGIIPWDDDIDIAMFRKDYDKFCDIASKELSSPYFLQTEYTDPSSLRGHAQLRNSLTTGILKFEKEAKYHFNQGIFIDIFPFDTINEDPILYEKQMEEARKLKQRCYNIYKWNLRYHVAKKEYKRIPKSIVKRIINIVEKNPIKHVHKYYHLFEQKLAEYNNCSSQLVGNLCFLNNYHRWLHKKYYNTLINAPFEFLTIPIPSQYNECLKVTFGNWHNFVIGTSLHGGVIFDPERPYTDYLK